MSKFKKIRTGVIGVGSMGQNHARIYSEISNLVAVSDSNTVQGKKVAEKLGVRFFSNYKDMFEEVDAISIAVPTFLHKEIAEEAMRAKVNILIEKPLSSNYNDAVSIFNKAKDSNVVISVGHIERFNNVIKYARRELRNKKWGEISTIIARRFSPFPTRINDVGVIFDLSIHDVDLINFLMNSSVESVYASGGYFQSQEHEDHVFISMNFSDGKIGVCETSWLSKVKVRELLIITNKFNIQIDLLSQSIILNGPYSESGENIDYNKIELENQESLKLELEDFLNAIINHEKPSVTLAEGLKAVEIVEKAKLSMDTNTVKYL